MFDNYHHTHKTGGMSTTFLETSLKNEGCQDFVKNMAKGVPRDGRAVSLTDFWEGTAKKLPRNAWIPGESAEGTPENSGDFVDLHISGRLFLTRKEKMRTVGCKHKHDVLFLTCICGKELQM